MDLKENMKKYRTVNVSSSPATTSLLHRRFKGEANTPLCAAEPPSPHCNPTQDYPPKLKLPRTDQLRLDSQLFSGEDSKSPLAPKGQICQLDGPQLLHAALGGGRGRIHQHEV